MENVRTIFHRNACLYLEVGADNFIFFYLVVHKGKPYFIILLQYTSNCHIIPTYSNNVLMECSESL